MKYEIVESEIAGNLVRNIVVNNSDGSQTVIPADLANSDYQAYLAYLAEQEETE